MASATISIMALPVAGAQCTRDSDPVQSLHRIAPVWTLLIALMALLLPQTAWAQDIVLSAVSVSEAGPAVSRLTLTFDRQAPRWSIMSNDQGRVEFTLTDTVRGAGSALGHSSTTLLRDIEINLSGSILSFALVGIEPIHIAVAAASPQQLVVTVTRATTAGVRSNQTAPGMGGQLPPADNPPPGEDHYELIPLKYADVSEIVGLLSPGVTVRSNDAFTPRAPGFGSPGNGTSNYTQPPTTNTDVDRPLGEAADSAIAVDRRLNAIWVKGSPERIARIKSEIAAIDLPVDSVLLETRFVELTETGARSIGLDFTNTAGQIGVATAQSGQFVPPGYMTSAPYLTSASLQAALYAQIQSGEGKIVSQPRIVAQSGGTAKIITGDALPILTAITLSGVNGVSQQVQYVNVGVTLQIAPRVSVDGYVSSHVFCVVSSVTGYSGGYPTISQREAETAVTARDGETFVIGGLTQENVINSRSKVPVLGDVPLIGQAFRVDRSTKSKTELYIVITPHVIRRLPVAAAGSLPFSDAGPPTSGP